MKAFLLLAALSLSTVVPTNKAGECRAILDERNQFWMDGEHGVQIDYEIYVLAEREGWTDCRAIIEEAIDRAIKHSRGKR